MQALKVRKGNRVDRVRWWLLVLRPICGFTRSVFLFCLAITGSSNHKRGLPQNDFHTHNWTKQLSFMCLKSAVALYKRRSCLIPSILVINTSSTWFIRACPKNGHIVYINGVPFNIIENCYGNGISSKSWAAIICSNSISSLLSTCCFKKFTHNCTELTCQLKYTVKRKHFHERIIEEKHNIHSVYIYHLLKLYSC